MTGRRQAAAVVGLPSVDFDGAAFTGVAELAVALAVSDRRVRQRADEERWLGIDAPGKGGRRKVYPLHALSAAVRAAVLAHRARTLAPVALPVPAEAAVPVAASNRNISGPGQLAGWQRERMTARLALLAHVEQLAGGLGIEAALAAVVVAAAAGDLPAPLQAMVPLANARAGDTRSLSVRTLKRWRAEARDAARRGDRATVEMALAPRDVARHAPPPWAGELLRLWQRPTRRPLAALVEDLRDALGPAAPSYAQARRYLARLSPASRDKGRVGPNALLAKKTHRRLTTDHLQPMDLVGSDGHTWKADVQHPVHGRPFRPEVCAAIDLCTRRVVGWSAGLAESQLVVMDALRHAVETGGMFGALRSDNGGGFTGQLMTAAATGLFARAGIAPSFATPGRAQARGKIERLQQSLWIPAAKKLPSYAGKDMDREARKVLSARIGRDVKRTGGSRGLIPWDEFLAFLRDEVAAYNARSHRGLPKVRDAETGRLRHLSPDEAWARHEAAGWQPERLPDAVLADLFRPYEERRVQRGWLRLPWGLYWHAALEALDGRLVRVGYDVHDGSRVWVRDADDRLVCVAVRDGNSHPEAASAVEHGRRLRHERRAKLKRDQLALIDAEAGLIPAPRAAPPPDHDDQDERADRLLRAMNRGR